MNTRCPTMTPRPLTPGDLQRLHDEALALAPQLRREAVDDFWRGANAALTSTWGAAHRSAERLAHRLSRQLSRRIGKPLRMG